MDSIIVTVFIKNRQVRFDVEFPINIEGGELKVKLFELMNEYGNACALDPKYHTVQVNKTLKEWKDDETLGQAGVYNGDCLTILSKI